MNYDLYLKHYGVSVKDGAPGRGSGRYPYGSGENPNQRSGDFLTRVKDLRQQIRDMGGYYIDPETGKKYKGDAGVAKILGLTSNEFRIQQSLARAEEGSRLRAVANRLRASGMSPTQIAREMGFPNESSIRNLLNEERSTRMKKAEVTAKFLKEMCDEKGMIDVGAGVEYELNCSRVKLDQALKLLEDDGYLVWGGRMPQPTNPGKQTTLKVLCPPGTPHKDIYDYGNIYEVGEYDKILTDNGENIRKAFEYPESMDPSRLSIRYSEGGGTLKDGLIEIRPGVKDLSLGDWQHYAQVRILVDGTHYIKGMACYGDPNDFPPGKDVIFNTKKHEGTPVLGEDKDYSVLKPISKDPDNPFGSLIKEHGGQMYYEDPEGRFVNPETGKRESLSLINKRADEGDWGEWSKNLPSQFLAKQNENLIKSQLRLSIADKQQEFEDILALTNPTVKKKLLYSFADDCDATAVHLKAAAMPRQAYQVIFPLTTLKDNEVYAPNYNNGEELALIRFPHAGPFEIPLLKVNNNNEEGKRILSKDAKDVVGISFNAATKLSGADFDGDTVLVIPNTGHKIKSKQAFEGLKDFDTVEAYGPRSTTEAYPRMKDTQKQMGVITNLITDMYIQGATDDELERAVKHSMVVIDAEKHNLDWRRSEKENGIAALKRKYQTHILEDGTEHVGGANTLLSLAKSAEWVTKRQGSPRIAEDGSLYWNTADDAHYVDYKTGEERTRTQESTKMAETKDARTLSSGYIQEEMYAEYANYMKATANKARKEMLATGNLKYDKEAAQKYDTEVKELDAALLLAERNAPKERRAGMIANSRIKAKIDEYPYLKDKKHKKELSKLRQQEMIRARVIVGAKRHPIDITDKQWEAIQAGAISDTKLTNILKYADSDRVRQLATPRTNKSTITPAKEARIRALKASDYSNTEIAKILGISRTSVSDVLNNKT